MLKDSLKAAFTESGLAVKEIAAKAGVSKRTIDNWLRPQGTNPGVLDLHRVCQTLGITVESLLREGKDEKMLPVAHKFQGSNIVPFSPDQDDDEIASIFFYTDVEAAAGNGKEPEDFPIQTPLPIFRDFLTPYKPSDVKAIRVSGDSMVDMYINDKDIVLFVPSENYGDGVYVISSETGLRVKKLQFSTTGKKLTIHSANPAYRDEEFTGEEIGQIRIVGKVIGWIHRNFF